MTEYDNVNNPRHYVVSSAIVEPIELLRHAPFDFGNAMKYVLRADFKGNRLEDLKKALWYIDCADESSTYDLAPYQAFFDRYGSLFRLFFKFLENESNEGAVAISYPIASATLRKHVERAIAVEEMLMREKENGRN